MGGIFLETKNSFKDIMLNHPYYYPSIFNGITIELQIVFNLLYLNGYMKVEKT